MLITSARAASPLKTGDAIPRAAWVRNKKAEWALALSSVCVGVGALEAAFRIKAWREDRGLLHRAMATSTRPARGATVTLGAMLRPSRSPRIIYELWPDMAVRFTTGRPDRVPVRVRTNSAGFRGRERPAEKPPGVYRVIGIGDSLMFGWGVDQGRDYLSLLERRLNRQRPERSWEVLNTAVPGYNTVMEVETLKQKALRYQPDLVIVGFCPNDAALPNFIRAERDLLSWRESYLKDYVGTLLRPPPLPADALLAAPSHADGVPIGDDPRHAPAPYRGHVGWDAYRRALEELKGLAQAHRFELLMTAFVPGATPAKRKGLSIAADLGYPIVDVGDGQQRYLAERGLRDYFGSPLTLSPQDGHPSEISHQIAAGELLAAVRSRVR